VNNDDEDPEILANEIWVKNHYDVDYFLECEDGDCFDEKDEPITFATLHDDKLPYSGHAGIISLFYNRCRE